VTGGRDVGYLFDDTSAASSDRTREPEQSFVCSGAVTVDTHLALRRRHRRRRRGA
jgi:hypothetical protein